jgi:soluble cytochrome b562
MAESSYSEANVTDAVATARELATHAAEIKHLQDGMDKLVADMDDIKKTLDAIQSTLSEAKGGWKILMLIGGASSVVGAGIVQVMHWWGK